MDNGFSGYGTLYVVATPIGHLEDITLRALNTLKSVPLIAAEDTRHSKRLLDHFDIKTRLVSCHEHNEKHQIPQFIDHLTSGNNLALISDAGTPSVSDPGFPLVQAAASAGVPVIPIPGPSAVIAALSVSGLPTDRFSFIGFPPKKTGKRETLLTSLSSAPETLIFYESPHRILDFIRQLIRLFGDRPGMLAREMTKSYEEYVRGSLSVIANVLEERPVIKGECTLLVGGFNGSPSPHEQSGDINADLDQLMSGGTRSPSQIAKTLSKTHGISRKAAYAMVMDRKTTTDNR